MTDKKVPKLKLVTPEMAEATLTPPRKLAGHGLALWNSILAEYMCGQTRRASMGNSHDSN